MGLSVNQFTYVGNDEFDLNFALGYTSRGDVTAYKLGEPLVDVNFEWVTDSKVRLTPGHVLLIGDELVFRRTVSKLSLPVNLNNPSEVTRESLTTAYKHLMYIAHELLDDRTSEVFPWELVGGYDEFTVISEFDYLTAYEQAKE